MARIELQDAEPEITAERGGQDQDVTLTVEADGNVITISVGHIYDSVESLADELEKAARDIRESILKDWEDTPPIRAFAEDPAEVTSGEPKCAVCGTALEPSDYTGFIHQDDEHEDHVPVAVPAGS